MNIKKQFWLDPKQAKKVEKKAKKEKRSESSIIRELIDNLES